MPYSVFTLADLKARLKDEWDGVRFWSDEEARLALNETLRDWNLFTGRWRRRVSYTTVASQHDYLLGSTITYSMAVRVGGLPLLPCSVFDLDLGRPSWRGETTATGGAVPTTPTVWAPISLQQIRIWPAPAVGVVDALVVDGVSATPILVEDGDVVDLGTEHLDVLVHFALHVAAFKQGGPQWQATLPYFKLFLQAAAEENGRLKASQKFRRAAGLDRRRDLQPTKGIPTQLDGLTESAS